jgi:transaldolase
MKIHQKLVKYINAMIRRIELLEVKIAATEVAINARNIRKDQSAKVLQTRGILYAKEARSMISDRLDLEKLRQKARDERTEKQYINELKKVYKRCKIHIKVWQKEERSWKALYKAVLKELLII